MYSAYNLRVRSQAWASGLKTRQWITVLLIEPPTSPVSNKGCYLVFSQGVPYAFEAGSQDRQEEIT